MTQPGTVDAIAFARANERLRQETETFEERKRQSRLWFQLRMGVGISSIVALGVIIAVSTYVIVSNDKFTPGVYLTAMVALLADVLGIITLVWKVILAPESTATLEPVTGVALPATE